MYSILAADPAVSCNKNRPTLMNFPIICDVPSECTYMYTNISDCPKYLESSQRYDRNIKIT